MMYQQGSGGASVTDKKGGVGNVLATEPTKRIRQPEDLSRLSETNRLADTLKARLYSQSKSAQNSKLQSNNAGGTKRKHQSTTGHNNTNNTNGNNNPSVQVPPIKKSKTITPDTELNAILNRSPITLTSKEELASVAPQTTLLGSAKGGLKLKPMDATITENAEDDVDSSYRRSPFYFIGTSLCYYYRQRISYINILLCQQWNQRG